MCYFYVQDTLLDNLYTNLKIFFISYIIMRPHKFVRYYKFYKMELKWRLNYCNLLSKESTEMKYIRM